MFENTTVGLPVNHDSAVYRIESLGRSFPDAILDHKTEYYNHSREAVSICLRNGMYFTLEGNVDVGAPYFIIKTTYYFRGDARQHLNKLMTMELDECENTLVMFRECYDKTTKNISAGYYSPVMRMVVEHRFKIEFIKSYNGPFYTREADLVIQHGRRVLEHPYSDIGLLKRGYKDAIPTGALCLSATIDFITPTPSRIYYTHNQHVFHIESASDNERPSGVYMHYTKPIMTAEDRFGHSDIFIPINDATTLREMGFFNSYHEAKASKDSDLKYQAIIQNAKKDLANLQQTTTQRELDHKAELAEIKRQHEYSTLIKTQRMETDMMMTKNYLEEQSYTRKERLEARKDSVDWSKFIQTLILCVVTAVGAIATVYAKMSTVTATTTSNK